MVKAIVQNEYGPPEVLSLEELPKPVPDDDEVLVRVRAAGANPADWRLMRADPFFIRLMMGGLLKPKLRTLGADIAGRVEAVGKNVVELKPGDDVFGDLANNGFGGFAEYVAVPATALVHMPANVTYDEAAAVPLAAMTALHALRDKGRLEPGQKVLINGASGGVGTFAVQIAKTFGADVTAVCSGRNADMVTALGADHVIDYTKEDPTRNGQRYDLIVDAAAYRSVRDYRRALRPKGRYVMIGGDTSRFFQMMVVAPWSAVTGGKKMEILASSPNQDDLTLIKELIEAGEVRPVIDRRYELREVPQALSYLEKGHARGKVVITM